MDWTYLSNFSRNEVRVDTLKRSPETLRWILSLPSACWATSTSPFPLKLDPQLIVLPSSAATSVDYAWILDNFAASLPEHLRKTVMSRLCRLAAHVLLEAAEAYLNIQPYKERPGHVYVHLRPSWDILASNADKNNEVDYVDIKVGKAQDLEARMEDYELNCVGKPILWAYSYETSHPKLIERLTHLTLWAMGAKHVPYSCHGCHVRHREHFSEEECGGLEVVAAIIEYRLGRIEELTVQVPIYA
ncbi:hypothetical protein DFH06DRAFT_1134707 [Mycena polygramma]|nr:hypothetical protein DFH06DRAFT_1134707 [Mycena polygramma]